MRKIKITELIERLKAVREILLDIDNAATEDLVEAVEIAIGSLVDEWSRRKLGTIEDFFDDMFFTDMFRR
mgnify:CR=1 FL=1